MGNCSNPYAVTDKKGRVLKVGGLRVSDISLFPSMLFSYFCYNYYYYYLLYNCFY